jgi:hypothetical protein
VLIGPHVNGIFGEGGSSGDFFSEGISGQHVQALATSIDRKCNLFSQPRLY